MTLSNNLERTHVKYSRCCIAVQSFVRLASCLSFSFVFTSCFGAAICAHKDAHIIDTAVTPAASVTFSIVCGAGSMHLSSVRPSVRLSVCPSICLSVFPSKPLLRRGRQETTIDCCTAHSSAAGECGRLHAV